MGLKIQFKIPMPSLSYLKSDARPVPLVTKPFHQEFIDELRLYAKQGRTAFISAETNESISYAQFLKAYECVNVYLKSINFGHKDIAGIVSQNCWQIPAIYMGISSRGGCFSGASPLFTDTELAQQFNDNGSKVVFCAKSSLETVLKARTKCPNLTHIVVIDEDVINAQHKITSFPDILRLIPSRYEEVTAVNPSKDLVMLPYSSGTTGKPKGVMLTHQNLCTVLRGNYDFINTQILYKMDPNWDWSSEKILCVLPFYHVYGFGMFWSCVANGGTAVIMKKFVPELLLKSIQNYRIRFLPAVPPILVFICGSDMVRKYDLSSLQFIMSAAAPAGKELIEGLKRVMPKLKQVGQAYGLSESAMLSHCSVFGTDAIGSCGRLVTNFEQKIIDRSTNQPVPIRQVGEICLRSPSVTIGYWKRPEATAETIDSEGWLHTGDIGYVDKNGYTYIVDRVKELIKVKGLQVAPAELEDILLSHDKIKDAAVIGIPHVRLGEAPKAFVVKSDSMLTAEEVDRYVASKCAPYKRLVGGIEFINEIPKSPTGKILRRILKEQRPKL